MSVFSKIPKSLTIVATAAALVAGVAYAQTSTDPAQPKPNVTGESGAALGNSTGSGVNSGSTMNNTATPAPSTDSSMNNAQTDIVSPQPRADRN